MVSPWNSLLDSSPACGHPSSSEEEHLEAAATLVGLRSKTSLGAGVRNLKPESRCRPLSLRRKYV